MDKLELALGLIEEALEEKRRLTKVNAELEKLREQRDAAEYGTNEYWARYFQIEGQFGAVPKKAHINDNIRIARRLLMGGRV